jgi:hypothetical protein
MVERSFAISLKMFIQGYAAGAICSAAIVLSLSTPTMAGRELPYIFGIGKTSCQFIVGNDLNPIESPAEMKATQQVAILIPEGGLVAPLMAMHKFCDTRSCHTRRDPICAAIHWQITCASVLQIRPTLMRSWSNSAASGSRLNQSSLRACGGVLLFEYIVRYSSQTFGIDVDFL